MSFNQYTFSFISINCLLVTLFLFNTSQSCFTDFNSAKQCITSAFPYKVELYFNESTCTNCSNVTTQSLTLIEGQSIYLNVSQFISNMESLSVYNITTVDSHLCNVKYFQEIFYHVIDNELQIVNFSLGRQSILLNSPSCDAVFHFDVEVYKDNCTFQNQLCSSNGRCIRDYNTKSFVCKCFHGYLGGYCTEYDDCLNNSCVNNSTCSSSGLNNTSYQCICSSQFTGQYCETCINGYTGELCANDINECHINSSICNYGNCTNLNGSFSCQCFVNVTGLLCNNDTYNNCLSNLCSNHSVCVDEYGSYRCDCDEGYEGEFCDKEINECIGNKCFLDGTLKCIDEFNGYRCQCRDGYNGVLCDNVIDKCNPNPCENGGLCTKYINSYDCTCQAGFAGTNCSEIANKCEKLDPCENGAQCIRTGSDLKDYSCVCLSGWTGQNCSIEINQCNSNPCKNNASCSATFNNFTCFCDSGWTGRYCESNINACASSPCANYSQCVDLITATDYQCVCPTGFTSKICDININDCENVSCNNGICVDGINRFHCQCDNGWFGEFCDTERDICSTHLCVNSLSCKNVNTSRGYECRCLPGFEGLNCDKNIDDCINKTCLNGGKCNDFIGFANCSCAPGYTGDICEIEIDECQSNPCQNNATCQDFTNLFFCKCQPGFNGTLCENNINECKLYDPCFNNATCVDKIDDFQCNCFPGYISKQCQKHICDFEDTCLNNGTCLKMNGHPGFNCTCFQGFAGLSCEVDIDECDSNPCANNATCINRINSYQCDCIFPYHGMNCTQHICERQPCLNNSTCIQLSDNYSCSCATGFQGRNCSKNVDDCINSKCDSQHTELCIDLINDYSCLCFDGYIGKYCNESICSRDNICNNGTCIQKNQTYICECDLGFTGKNCSVNIDDCVNITCGNGVCIDGINNFTCQCPTLKSGRFCENELDFCKSSPCFHNSTCLNVPVNRTYKCNCNYPYGGKNCHQHPCDQSNICNNGTCVQQPNNFSCICEAGYRGRYCNKLIDYCDNITCHNGGICLSHLKNFSCQCKQNFTGSFCETKIDYCVNNSCSNMSICFSNIQNKNYSCDCQPGYFGTFCDKNQCDNFNPCKNESTCVISNDGTTKCLCLPGYTSDNCSQLIDNCISSQCFNNGTCVNDINSYSCRCSSGFTGDQCQYYIGDCLRKKCLNNGKCVANETSSFCNCSIGFYGEFCEKFKCPCQHTGRCIRENESSSVTCICRTNYTGQFCEKYIGDCFNDGLQCSSPSFCKLSQDGFYCDCPPHLGGDLCDTSEDCRTVGCKNNGSCIFGSTNYVCSCKPGFTGSQCQTDINECFTKPCENNGICIEQGVESFKCICENNFSGNFCQILPESSRNVIIQPSTSLLDGRYSSLIETTTQSFPSSLMSNIVDRTSSFFIHRISSKMSKGLQYTSILQLESSTLKFSPSKSSSTHLSLSQSKSKHVFYRKSLLETSVASSVILDSHNSSIIETRSQLFTQSTSSVTFNIHSIKPTFTDIKTSEIKKSKPSSLSTRTESLLTISRMETYKFEASTALNSIMITSTISATTEKPSTTTTVKPYVNLTCVDTPCNGFPCFNETDFLVNFRCQCPFPRIGPVCSNNTMLRFPRFNGHSYIEIPQIKLNKTINTIVLSFRTSQSHGLLFYANHSVYEDFIKSEIKDSYFQVSMSFGDNRIFSLRGKEKVDSGGLIYANIRINANTRTILLQVNGSIVEASYRETSLRHIDLNSNWFVGGIPDALDSTNFTGCLKDFQVNNKPISLTDRDAVVTWHGISECEDPICSKGVCLNGAQCFPDISNLENFTCICKEGFIGERCDKHQPFCSGDPCNGGKCVWTAAKEECLCKYGKTGLSCLNETFISIPQFSTFLNYSSYMEYPQIQTGQHAAHRFEIRMQFKLTERSNKSTGQLLMFMGQSTIGASTDDFFAIGIHQDYVLLIYNLGSGIVVIQSTGTLPHDRNWHFLIAGRSLQHGYLYLNSQSKAVGTSPGVLTGLNIFTPLYIGGVPDFSKLPPPLSKYFSEGFTGSIHDVAIRTRGQSFVPLLTLTSAQVSSNVIGIPVDGGLNIKNYFTDYCAANPCLNGGTCRNTDTSFTCDCVQPYQPPYCASTNVLCVEYNPCAIKSSCRVENFDIKCDCPFGYSGIFCQKVISIDVPYFVSNSFISLPISNIRSQVILSMQFKPAREYGLLLYVAHNMNQASGDFFAVSLWNRYVYVKCNLGSHTISLRTRNQVSLCKQHTIYIKQQGRDIVIILDSNYPVGVSGSSLTTKLDVGRYFYLGGVPYINSINQMSMKDMNKQSGFTGSISNLQINGKQFVLNVTDKQITGRNIKPTPSPSCDVCSNNAVCLQQPTGNVTCSCALGFIGETCKRGVSSMTSVYFNKNSYWYTRSDTLESNTLSYLLSFKTSLNESQMILWHGKINQTNDFLSVAMERNGHLNITLSVGGMESSLASSKITVYPLNDGQFHTLRIERSGNNVLVVIDARRPIFTGLTGANTRWKSYGYIYIGGFPESTNIFSGNRFTSGFTGCMSNVTLSSNISINFADHNTATGHGLQLCD